jgi:hypothetical protein
MADVRWSIHVPADLDRALRLFLASRGGKKGDLSRFVEEAVLDRLLLLDAADAQTRNADLTEQDALELVTQAVKEVRRARGRGHQRPAVGSSRKR